MSELDRVAAEHSVSGGLGRNPQELFHPIVDIQQRNHQLRLSSVGGPTGTSLVPNEFIAHAIRTARDATIVAQEFRPPEWLVELLRTQANPEQVLAKVVERVIADPHEGTLLEAHAIINELGRDPKFGAVLGLRLTQDLINRVIGGGK